MKSFQTIGKTISHKYMKQCATSVIAMEIQSENMSYKISLYI